ncbi:hypothetical protein RRX38_15745 [Pseudomonas sp. DTU_2021_1001937_2_SI_NGA_ILE_001]|uniref:hypothetical protein n=1 Tax=Pseudomonas sp. DTU_2021_1001937_2_SI_NGA_ILE_001 TaxID=3077589 RepID=UPI0028FC29B5|nr:hypothetical protein [Pseudomonas sp. DTU_2021_1001937_2_SI_NGA_ILE_001]WNW12532.1 hypothetical protein RRX38_15745 [Pseudomonas sp. DTU_2021_1001937_2_SI_NGA_ILE_001]
MKLKTLALTLGLTFNLYPAAPASADADRALQPIVLTLFLHDQLSPQEKASIGPDHLAWLIQELTLVTGRRVQIISVTDKPGYTDFGYRVGDPIKSLAQWHERVGHYIDENNLPVASRRHRYVLVTRHRLDSITLGIAYIRSDSAIASIRSYNTIGHEVGHLLGASHEAAHLSFAHGLPCGTVMSEAPLPSCYVFSDNNRQAIRDYLKGP